MTRLKRQVCSIDPSPLAAATPKPPPKHRLAAKVRDLAEQVVHPHHLPAVCAPTACTPAAPKRVYRSVSVAPPAPVTRKPAGPNVLHCTRVGPASPYDNASLTYLYALLMVTWARPTAVFGSLTPVAPALRGVSLGAVLAAPVIWPMAMITDVILLVAKHTPRSWWSGILRA